VSVSNGVAPEVLLVRNMIVDYRRSLLKCLEKRKYVTVNADVAPCSGDRASMAERVSLRIRIKGLLHILRISNGSFFRNL
jgi:hypothetical protein